MNAEAGSLSPKPETPQPAAERIAALDVLRGVALFGIFIMNMPGFSHSVFSPPPADLAPVDAWVSWLRDLLFAGKFNLMFGLLFGIGFCLQLGRLEAARPGRGATAIYARRLAVLLAIGLVHAALLWPGDVLVVYAVLGFALLAIRRWSERAVLALLVACLVFPALAELLRPVLLSISAEAIGAFEVEDYVLSNDAAFGRGSFADAVFETMRVFAWYYGSALGAYSLSVFYVQMATGILLGLLFGRRGWVERLPALAAPIRSAQLAALGVALLAGALSLALAALNAALVARGAAAFALGAGFLDTLARTVARPALMAFYAHAAARARPARGHAVAPSVRARRTDAAQQLPAADADGPGHLLRLGPRLLGSRLAVDRGRARDRPVLPRPAAAQRGVAGALPLRPGRVRLAPPHLRPARALSRRRARARLRPWRARTPAPAAHTSGAARRDRTPRC